MVNNRSKLKKIENTTKPFSPEVADSDHLPTLSGAFIGSNDDLLTEILRRLPTTAVLRFKSVSKHWQSLLTHRRFALLRILRSPGFFLGDLDNPLYIPFDDEDRSTPPIRDLNLDPDLNGMRIEQSCNGLLLCCSHLGNESRKYYVFNPTTKQFAHVPSIYGRGVRRNIRFMGLAFHQTDCVRHKVVCFLRAIPDDNNVHRIQIYSSETRKWKTCDQSFHVPHHTQLTAGVYWNDAIHWVMMGRTLMYFKLNVEQLHTFPLPLRVPVAPRGRYYFGGVPGPLYFGESGGHLHLVEIADTPLHLNVYEMLSDRSGWFVKYEVELDDLANACPEMIINHPYIISHDIYYEFNVLDLVRGEKEEETFMVLATSLKIVRYNLVEKTFKQIYAPDIRSIKAHRYIEYVGSF